MADGEDYEMCVGPFCFLQPYPDYAPPPYYHTIPHREYKWKASGKLITRPDLHLKFQHVLSLPNGLGLRDDGRWRWQWVPLSLLVGLKIDSIIPRQLGKENIQEGNYSNQSAFQWPYVRVKILTPIFGKLALQPALELFPILMLSVKREFELAGTRFTVQSNFEVNNSSNRMKRHCWMLRLDWHPAGSTTIQCLSAQDSVAVKYSKGLALSEDCKAVASAVAELPSDILQSRVCRFCDNLPVKLKFDSLKISQIIGTKAKRVPPLPPSSYLRAAKLIGSKDVITIVPGHWIDPGVEVGALGEREFNLEVANMLEKQLRGNGWEVLRPDRDAPLLSWEEYLNWVSKQTLKGIPVVEIHGQGSSADYRGLVLGVIGDDRAPLTKELALKFGYFQMDWRELGVPRRGGVIIESFNADEVLQMAPWHRKWAVRRLSNRIVSSIERASRQNRVARGIYADLELEGDLLHIDED